MAFLRAKLPQPGVYFDRSPSVVASGSPRKPEARTFCRRRQRGPRGQSPPAPEVDLCNGTQRLTEAQADLEALGAGKKPTVGGEALSETSGGVSAGAMVGVAGLVMAASLLVVVRLVRTG